MRRECAGVPAGVRVRLASRIFFPTSLGACSQAKNKVTFQISPA